jgi:hypothetical protein
LDVVVPSVPGYGFSDPSSGAGGPQTAGLFVKLMKDALGYERFVARGGHFAVLAEPELLAGDTRRFFRPLRAVPTA